MPARTVPAPRSPRRIALYAALVCALAVAAAVVSFVKGSWLGVVWVLLAGLTSNMAWYYARSARAAGQRQGPAQPPAATAGE